MSLSCPALETSFRRCVALCVFASISVLPATYGQIDASFRLGVDSNGVAIQFDLISGSPIVSDPKFEGLSDHKVRSGTLDSGARRFVVYSVSGEPIAQNGEVAISFQTSSALRDEGLSLANVIACDKSGNVVQAFPNTKPIIANLLLQYQSLRANDTVRLHDGAFDVDGEIAEFTVLLISEGEEQIQVTDANWQGIAPGLYRFAATAKDNQGLVTDANLGTVRVYDQSEIIDYDTFAEIHFGSDSGAQGSSFESDSIVPGVANGLIYLFEENPYNPNLSVFPQVDVIVVDDEKIVRVTLKAPSQNPDIGWALLSSRDGVEFDLVDTVPFSYNENETDFVRYDVKLEQNEEVHFFKVKASLVDGPQSEGTR